MKKEIVSQSTSKTSACKMRGAHRLVAALMAVFALIAFASSSALAEGTKCQAVQWVQDSGYPYTATVYATTATDGATILATMGNYFVPADPTHGANCSPTGTTFTSGGTFLVFVGQYKHFKAIACKVGRADSDMTSFEVDNSGN